MASAYEHDADMGPGPADESDEKKQKKEHTHGHSHGHGHEHSHEHIAKVVALGTVTVGGTTFAIDREGQVEAGLETTFGVEIVGGGTAVPTSAWIANPDGEKLCDPVSGDGHDNHWHFTVCPLVPVKKSVFVLKVGNEEVVVDWARLAAPCKDGILSVLKAADAPEWRGFLEVKLHGDAGDMEMWLHARNEGSRPTPLDVPKETVLRLTSSSHAGKTVELRVRNMDKNEDEAGAANMRNDRTNYFIFPGESGQDPEWLKGEKWRGMVTVAFEAEGKSYGCEPFILVPHEAL